MRIIIVGKGGSGKDTLAKRYKDRGFSKSISCTSRPPRDGELDGFDYYFRTKEWMEEYIRLYGFHEHAEFNGWLYGTTRHDWNNSQIFIKTPSGVKQILEEDRESCFIIYLDISEEIREERLLARQDVDSVVRRLEADSFDFENFIDFDLRITNSDF